MNKWGPYHIIRTGNIQHKKTHFFIVCFLRTEWEGCCFVFKKTFVCLTKNEVEGRHCLHSSTGSASEGDAEEKGTKDLQPKPNWRCAELQCKSPRFCANHWQSPSFFLRVPYFSCQLCFLNTRVHVYTHRGTHWGPCISFTEGALNLDFLPKKIFLCT